MKFYIIVSGLIIVIDFVTKFFVQRHLAEIGTFPLIEGVFHFTYARNPGAAFGMLGGMRWWLVGLTVLIIIGIIYTIATRKFDDARLKYGLAFILGGAVGNLIDRVFLGYVVDFLDFRAINFAIFNVADIFITVGAGILIFHTIFTAKNEAKKDG